MRFQSFSILIVKRHNLLLILFLLIIIILFLVTVDFRGVYRQLQSVNWRYIALASFFLVSGLLLYAVRWRFLIRNKIDLLPTFHASNIGHMTNILVPFRAGEVARVISLGAEKESSVPEITSSVVVERWLEQVMRVSALAGAIILGRGIQRSMFPLAGLILILGTAFILLVALVHFRAKILARIPSLLKRWPKLSEENVLETLGRLLDGLAGLGSVRMFIISLSASILTWICWFWFHFFALCSIETNLAVREAFAVTLGSIALAPPSAPTQPGLYHASIVIPLHLAGFNKELLTSYSIILHLLQMIWMVGLGVWGLNHTSITLANLLEAKMGQE
jgi:uncharacterized protein (TIRG00374 family)